jgi:hypothetical protein
MLLLLLLLLLLNLATLLPRACWVIAEAAAIWVWVPTGLDCSHLSRSCACSIISLAPRLVVLAVCTTLSSSWQASLLLVTIAWSVYYANL